MGTVILQQLSGDIWQYETFCGPYLCDGMCLWRPCRSCRCWHLCRTWSCWSPWSWLCCCCPSCWSPWSWLCCCRSSCPPCPSSLCSTSCPCSLHHSSTGCWSNHRPPARPCGHQAGAPRPDQLCVRIRHQDPQASHPPSSNCCPSRCPGRTHHQEDRCCPCCDSLSPCQCCPRCCGLCRTPCCCPRCCHPLNIH